MPVVLDAILKVTPDISELSAPEGIKRVVERLLAKTPEDRYRTADEALIALGEATDQSLILETAAARESFLQASRLVGREQALSQLTDLLEAARDGKGSLWLIAGESGVGKSRLVAELRAQALVRGALAMQGQEVSEGGSSYQLWRDVLRWLSLFTAIDDSEAGILKPIVPDLDRLLGRPVSAAPELAPQAAQERLLKVITALFQRQKLPLVLILEDVHWSSESLDILKALAEPIKKLPVLILATFRDDERPDLPKLIPGANVLKLERLSYEAIAQLSESMIGVAGRLPEVVALLERETEGNVFFAVEVVRALAEEAGQLDRVGSGTLPRHVSAGGISQIVQRRLSHVPAEDRALLQLAAVLGRNIDLKLLEAAEPGRDLQRWLVDCADVAVLAVGDERWRFSHDKLRDGLRDELTAEGRSKLYRRAAEVVEMVYPDMPDQATRLAVYWNQAGDAGKERHYTTIAARQAHRNGAILEAIRLYRRAIELLMALPETSQRNAEELALQLDLGANVLPAKGYGSAETFETYERSRILCQKLGTAPQNVTVVSGLNVFYVVRAKFKEARELAQQAILIGEESGLTDLMLEAYRMMAAATFWPGDFATSRIFMDKCYNVYQPDKHKANIVIYGQDAAVCVLANGGWLRWFQGYPQQALDTTAKSIALAEQVNHAFSLCFALSFRNNLLITLRDAQGLAESVDRLAQLARANDIKQYLVNVMAQAGWLSVLQGKLDEGITQIKQGIGISQAVGSLLSIPFWQTLLAQAYAISAKPADGLVAINDGLALFPANESRFYEAEMYRVKGQLLLQNAPMSDSAKADAIACFRQALEIARKNGGVALELRAAISLFESEGESARQELTDVYSRYTEGFDTHDLQRAKSLLESVQDQ